VLLCGKIYRVRRLTHALLWLGLLVFLHGDRIGLSQQQRDSLASPLPQVGPSHQGESSALTCGSLFAFSSPKVVEVPPATYQPISVGHKFCIGAIDTFRPPAYLMVGISAAYRQAQNDPKLWGQGWNAYGKRYAAAFGNRTTSTLLVESVLPSLTHQDPRYFRMGQGGFSRRTGYALSRTLVTRGDNGKNQFNISDVFGNAISAGISNAYYPGEDRTLGKNLGRWGVLLGVDALFNVFNEYWPDVSHRLFKK